MQDTRIISGETEEIIWQQIKKDFPEELLPADFHITIEQQERNILLDIEENPATTTFSSYLYNRNSYKFAICPQGFIDEIGKFFGMEDVVLGYEEFDDRYIIKTNQEEKTAVIFADPGIRKLLVSIPDLSFGIVQYTMENENGKAPFLELKIEGSVTELVILKRIYEAFFKVLVQIEA